MSKIKVAEECRYKPTRDEMWTISCLSVQMKESIFPHVYKFINSNKDAPAPVLIEALRGIVKYKPKDPWAYATKIVNEQTKNFNAGKNIKEHERVKKEEAQGMKGFGNILKKILATEDTEK